MRTLLLHNDREFIPQGSDAPVGMTRGMRWRLPFGRLWFCTEQDSP